MTSIFTGENQPEFGKYYVSNGITDPNQAINSIVTVTDTKVIFQTIYKNEQYQKKEFTDPTILSVDTDIYLIEKINMGDYLVDIGIDTNNKNVFITYFNLPYSYTNTYKSKGVNNPKNFPLISFLNQHIEIQQYLQQHLHIQNLKNISFVNT
jgi:CxxC motif-containing protein